MARMRSIKPEFWLDRKLARTLSRDERLLYIALWNQADEHARCNGDPRVVLGQAFPYDDDLDAGHVDKMLQCLDDAGVAQRYDYDGDPYLFLPKLDKHQRLEPGKGESRYPAPPNRDVSARNPDESARDLDSAQTDPRTPAPKHVAGGMEHVAGGMEHVAGGRGAERAVRIPEDFEPTNDLRQWASETTPEVNIDDQTMRFIDYWRGVSGARGRKLDWPGTWRNWMRKAQDDAPTRGTARASPSDQRAEQNLALVRQYAEQERQAIP